MGEKTNLGLRQGHGSSKHSHCLGGIYSLLKFLMQDSQLLYQASCYTAAPFILLSHVLVHFLIPDFLLLLFLLMVLLYPYSSLGLCLALFHILHFTVDLGLTLPMSLAAFTLALWSILVLLFYSVSLYSCSNTRPFKIPFLFKTCVIYL